MEHRTVTRRQALILTSMGVAGTVLAAQSGVVTAVVEQPGRLPASDTDSWLAVNRAWKISGSLSGVRLTAFA